MTNMNQHGENYTFLFLAAPGESDDNLKWPAIATLTIELINKQGGENISKSETAQWNNPTCNTQTYITHIDHNIGPNFLNNDTLSLICQVKLQ